MTALNCYLTLIPKNQCNQLCPLPNSGSSYAFQSRGQTPRIIVHGVNAKSPFCRAETHKTGVIMWTIADIQTTLSYAKACNFKVWLWKRCDCLIYLRKCEARINVTHEWMDECFGIWLLLYFHDLMTVNNTATSMQKQHVFISIYCGI